ncbi:MAG: hypothetical protein LAT56_01825 [Wenzhouxiangella sp.]|nr:hypothetical protein [Wenzhouxiangella sp.]
MKNRLVWILAACGLLSGALIAPAMAQKVWTGSMDEDWQLAGNWNPSGVPAASDPVVIDGPEGTTWPRLEQAPGLAQSLVLGQAQRGRLTLGQTAVLAAQSLLLAEQAGSDAELVIEGVVGGQLDLPAVIGGSGDSRLVFRHNQSNYEFRRPSGTPVDTSGSLMLVQDQFFATRLLGQHSHTGGTRVRRGDLDLFGGQLIHPAVALEVAPEAFDIGALFIRNGSQADVGPTLVAGASGSFANLQVGPNTTLDINGLLAAGVSGTAFVDATGGVLTAQAVSLGSNLPESGQAQLNVLGASGRVFVSGDVDLGGPAGLARYAISSGGQSEIGGDLRVGVGAGGRAELALGVVASLTVDGQLGLDNLATLHLEIDTFSHPVIQVASVLIAPGAALQVPDPTDPPDPGSSFVVLEAPGGISGTFGTVSLPVGWSLIQESTRLLVALALADEIFADRFE